MGSQGWKAVAAICVALLVPVVATAAPAGARTLYVGGTKQYSVALKSEAGEHYVIQLGGSAKCHFNEPYEYLGFYGFSMFPAPTLMRERGGEWRAGDSQYEEFGSGSAGVRASFGAAAATGTYAYEYSEESEHCSTGGRVPFKARRYVPAGSAEAGAPIAHLAKTYYGKKGPLEIYLAVRGATVGGLRGDFVSACRVGRHKGGDARPLFSVPKAYKRGKDGRFDGDETAAGTLGHGARFKEWFGLSGRVGHDAIVGTYRRVRTVTRGHRQVEHCVTGPLPFAAARYVPARR
jgi:hypothetical protein